VGHFGIGLPVSCGSALAAGSCVMSSEVKTGTIKWFDNKKGFGFIVGEEGQRDIFVHYSSIAGDGMSSEVKTGTIKWFFRSLRDGERVEYELVDSDKGPQAANVRRVEAAEPAGKA
jgi:CspA family cold shock protein